MVKLILHLIKKGERHYILKRTAPSVPNGICWQVNMVFDDGVQDNDIFLVTVNADGIGLVRMRCQLDFNEDLSVELQRRLDAGWKIDDGDLYEL